MIPFYIICERLLHIYKIENYFDILPVEILLIIFNYCDYYDLTQLNLAYNKFYGIISLLLEKKSEHLLITGQKSKEFRERCQPLISSHELKLSIHNNWKHGIYATESFDATFSLGDYLLFNNLQITRDAIWISSQTDCHDGSLFSAHSRTMKNSFNIADYCNSSIFNIVPCNDDIITNHRDNSIRKWTIEILEDQGEQYLRQQILLPSSSYNDIYFMDATSQTILTSSGDGEIKIWGYVQNENTQNHIIEEKNRISIYKNSRSDFNLELGYCPIAFDPTGTKFSVCYHSKNYASYFIHDLNKCCTEKYVKIDDGDNYNSNRTQLLWKDSNEMLLMRKCKIVKLDARTPKVVHTWDASYYLREKFQPRIYSFEDIKCNYELYFSCMSSDNSYAIVTGTSYGQIILWDERQNNFIQTYEIPEEDRTHYVNCLQFDSSHIYAAAFKVYEYDFAKNIVS